MLPKLPKLPIDELLPKILELPRHVQGAAFIHATENGSIPSIAALLHMHGRSNRVGQLDVERHNVEFLSLLYKTTVDDTIEQDDSLLVANYDRFQALQTLLGSKATEFLMRGTSVSETAKQCDVDRKTIQRAFATLREKFCVAG